MAGPIGRGPTWRLAAAAPVLAALLAGGCAGKANLADDIALVRTDPMGLSPSSAALLQEAQRGAKTRLSGAGVGAGLGAAAGIAAALLSRGPSSGEKALIAGGSTVFGAALGYAAGHYVDARNRQAAGRQATLASLTTAAEQDAARYENARLLAQASIEESGREIERLNGEYSAGAVTADAYREQAKSLAATAKALRSMAKESEQVVLVMHQDIQEGRRRGQDTSGLEAERQRLQAENESLAAQYRELLGIVDRAPPAPKLILAEAVLR
ncbi:MAG: hypothetical protein ICV73_00870 [Acetobacteraceae bacterium]|nr:hypothetical protein [Acetobacteraceae bacterium]